MILIGDKLIPFENISKISIIDDIKHTNSNSTIIFYFQEEILKYCFENELSSAVIVSNIKEAIYANSLNAKYIICKEDLAIKIQKIADNYMFDTRVLAIIENSDEIESVALNEIDGAIYKDLL
jgi:hypothetical protein